MIAIESPDARTTRRTTRGEESAWTATRKRVEKLDCAVYAVWLETYLELSKKTARFWDELERKVQPVVTDMFSQNNVDAIAKTVNKPVAKGPEWDFVDPAALKNVTIDAGHCVLPDISVDLANQDTISLVGILRGDVNGSWSG